MIKLDNQGSQGGILFPSGNLVGNNVMPKPHHFQCPAASASKACPAASLLYLLWQKQPAEGDELLGGSETIL
jgi:hypothetical protein